MGVAARRMKRGSKRGSVVTSTNIFRGKLFTSNAGESGGQLSNLTDGSASTRWISNVQSPATLTVDIGGVYTLNKLNLLWAADTTKNYNLQVSMDGTTFTTIATGATNGAASPAQTITHTDFTATAKGRYLRVNLLDMWNTSYGNSLWEIEGYGVRDTSYAIGSITNFTAAVSSTTQVNLTWGYSGDPLTKYTITRNGAALTTISNQATTTFSDTTVSMGTTYTYAIVGTYQSGGGTTNTATASATLHDPNQLRDAFYQPFTSTSFWNLPIVDGVETEDVLSIRSQVKSINYNEWSHGVYEGTDSDPWVTCTDYNYGNGTHAAHTVPTTQWRIPSYAQPAAGQDAHLEVVNRFANGDVKLLEMFEANRNGNTVTCSRMAISNLKGEGGGPSQGVRAYGGSAIGGLIRDWEVDPTHPKYSGRIDHVLAIGIDRWNMLGKNASVWDGSWDWYADGVTNTSQQPGWNSGLPRKGYGRQTGYVWPATEQDGFSMAGNEYNGNIRMGSYFCIPSSVNVNGMGLNAEGLMLAKALQDYGAYVSDAAYRIPRSRTLTLYC